MQHSSSQRWKGVILSPDIGVSLVHPDHKLVIPLAPEMIVQHDGEKKNDCERNASRRFLDHFRREHPHLKTIVLADSLASNGPYIKKLRAKNMRFILGAKRTDHRFLFDWVNKCHGVEVIEREERTPKGNVLHRFRFVNDVPLNDTHFDESVNFLEYWEIRPDKTTTHWSWVTDLELNERTVMQVMRSARSRWRIENENFQTLKKSNGYNIEHNFGHGKKSLCIVFPMLCVLAFLIDQTQELCCPLFQKALRSNDQSKSSLWNEIIFRFKNVKFNDWITLWNMIS